MVEGKGARRKAGSEGSRRRKRGPDDEEPDGTTEPILSEDGSALVMREQPFDHEFLSVVWRLALHNDPAPEL